MTATMKTPLWRRPLPLVVAGMLAVCAALYLLAQSGLSDLDRIVASGGVASQKGDPLSPPKSWALFLVSQVLALRQPGAATIAPGKVFQDCPDCPQMVEIPPGFYLMGSPLTESGRYQHFFGRYPVRAQIQFLNREGPRRLVRIDHAFALSRYEITFAEWEAAQDDPDWLTVTGRPARKPVLDAPDYLKRAVTKIDRNDAEAYAVWMSAKTGQHYRLPTEAEWEYAARAGTTTRYPWGDDIGVNNANCRGCDTVWPETRIGPGGMFPPNNFGLYDMIGNGWEWVQDCFTPWHPASVSDGSAYVFPGCEFGVFKGGGAFPHSWQNRSAMRVGPHPYNNDEGSTIRLLREMPAP